jgi:hypothetical protein
VGKSFGEVRAVIFCTGSIDPVEYQQWNALCNELNQLFDRLNELIEESDPSRAAAQFCVFKDNLRQRWLKRELPPESWDWALESLFSRFGRLFRMKDRYDWPVLPA